MSDLCGGEQHVHAVYHAKTGPENGHDDDGIVLDHTLGADFQRGFDLFFFGGNAVPQAFEPIS